LQEYKQEPMQQED